MIPGRQLLGIDDFCCILLRGGFLHTPADHRESTLAELLEQLVVVGEAGAGGGGGHAGGRAGGRGGAVFISVCTALLAEGITWVLVYRTDKYKRLKAEVEKQSKKLEKKKETITESAGRQQKKKIERQEEKLKNNNRDLSMVRMKSMFAIGFCFTALMGMFNSIFDGRVVAKLPFTPLSYIQGLSHRNLLGDDTTDCSFIFLYILCTMSIRQNIQKILGLAPSRAATKQAGGFLGPPPPSGKFS